MSCATCGNVVRERKRRMGGELVEGMNEMGKEKEIEKKMMMDAVEEGLI